MLTEEQKAALNNILLDYWQDMSADNIIDDVIEIADPIATAKYLEAHATSSETLAAEASPEEGKDYYLSEAKKFRQVAQLLRKGG